MGAGPSPAALEAGRVLFAQECLFVGGAATAEALPETSLPEIAFAGRSNAGKSSLLNALTGRAQLARVSRTPGRTRQINFFRLGGRLMLADLPGYGFARASKTESAHWKTTISEYLRGRANLRRVMLLIDSRRGIMEADAKMMDLLDQAAVSYQLVLTKTDRLKPPALATGLETIGKQIAQRGAAHPEIAATSALTGEGIPELRAALGLLAAPRAPR